MATSQEQEELDHEERRVFRSGLCPDCSAPLEEGPHGGLSVNMYCSRAACGSRFNEMGPFGVMRISHACPNATGLG
jgi:hypothetical protein